MFGDYSTEIFWISNYPGLAQQKKYLGFCGVGTGELGDLQGEPLPVV